MWISPAFRCTVRTTNQKFMFLFLPLSLARALSEWVHFFPLHQTTFEYVRIHYTHNVYSLSFHPVQNSGVFLHILDEWNTLPFLQMLKHFEHTFSTLFDSLAQSEATNIRYCHCCRYCFFLFSLNLFIHSFLALSCGFAYVFQKWQTKWKHGKKEPKQAEQNIPKKAKIRRERKKKW